VAARAARRRRAERRARHRSHRIRTTNLAAKTAELKAQSVKFTTERGPLKLASGVTVNFAYLEGPAGAKVELGPAVNSSRPQYCRGVLSDPALAQCAAPIPSAASRRTIDPAPPYEGASEQLERPQQIRAERFSIARVTPWDRRTAPKAIDVRAPDEDARAPQSQRP
jgi:hypothetical protein